jgi:hypothetical protein
VYGMAKQFAIPGTLKRGWMMPLPINIFLAVTLFLYFEWIRPVTKNFEEEIWRDIFHEDNL